MGYYFLVAGVFFVYMLIVESIYAIKKSKNTHKKIPKRNLLIAIIIIALGWPIMICITIGHIFNKEIKEYNAKNTQKHKK